MRCTTETFCKLQSNCVCHKRILNRVASTFSRTNAALANVPRRAARGLVMVYRYTLSPLVGFHCRHLPTCSAYADEALDRFGLWAGGWMTLARLLRCHPFGTSGLDVVPGAPPSGARWYVPWRYARWRGTNPGPAPHGL
jgi:putative membrane protein insertion efficiency factor